MAEPYNPYEKTNFLTRFGIALGGDDALTNFGKQQTEIHNKQVLADLMNKMNTGEIDKKSALTQYAQITGDYNPIFGVGAQDPSAIREYEYVNSLTPEQRTLYFQTKRATPMFDRGGSQVFTDNQGNIIKEIDKTLPPEQTPETKGAQAAAVKNAELGIDAANKAVDVESSVTSAKNVIDSLLKDEEGLNSITGGVFGLQGRAASVLPLSPAQRRAQGYLDQLKGKVFLQAREALKGAGALTDFEGAKGEDAFARLNQAQTTEDFKVALQDLNAALDTALAASRRKGAQVPQVGAQQPATAIPNQNPAAPAPIGTGGGAKVINFGDLK